MRNQKSKIKKVFLILFSQDKNSMKLFLKFFKKLNFFNGKIVLRALKSEKYVVSVLKSPHVNKTAQEQFCKKSFCCTVMFKPINSSYVLPLLKSLTEKRLFNVTMASRIDLLESGKTNIRLTNPDACLLRDDVRFKPEKYLNLLDTYGELENLKLRHKEH